MILPGFPTIFAGRAKIFATWVGSGYTTTDLTTVTLSGIPLGVARTNRRLLAVMQWEPNANGASAVTSLSIVLNTAVDNEATSSTQLYSTIQTSVSGPCIVGVSCGDSSNNVAIVPPTLGRFSVTTQDTNAMDIFFKPDGTKMYVVGDDGNDVNEYSLSTAWNVTTASYLQNFSVNSQETTPQSVFFKPDGTKMYVIGNVADNVNEYNLSTAWNVTTASYSQNFSVAAQETRVRGISFKDDGTKMYVIGDGGTGYVNEYSISTAWDLSTAVWVESELTRDNIYTLESNKSTFAVFSRNLTDNTDVTTSGAVGQKSMTAVSFF